MGELEPMTVDEAVRILADAESIEPTEPTCPEPIDPKEAAHGTA